MSSLPPPVSSSTTGNYHSRLQNQAETLNQETELYRKRSETAQQEFYKTSKECEEIKAKVHTLKHEVELAKEELVQFDGEKNIWNEEQARLNRQMEYERNEIIKCTKEEVTCNCEETKRRGDFCNTMIGMTENHRSLLRQFEYARLKKLVSAETLDFLVDKCRTAATTTCTAANNNDICDQLSTSAMTLKNVTNKRIQEKTANALLHEQLALFRKQVLSCENAGVMEEQLFQMEESWKETDWAAADKHHNGGGSGSGDTLPVPEHLENFYGPTDAATLADMSALTEHTGGTASMGGGGSGGGLKRDTAEVGNNFAMSASSVGNSNATTFHHNNNAAHHGNRSEHGAVSMD